MIASAYVFWSCFTFGLLSFFWELYLSWRQYKKRRDTPDLPSEFQEILDENAYKKARLYSLDKERFGFVSAIWSAMENSIILLFNLIVVFWNISGHIAESWGYNSEIIQSLVFILLTIMIDTVMNMPWKMYDTFIIEEKHGFNKQTFGFFVKDQIKKLILSMAMGLPLITALIWIIKAGGDYFFFFVWVFLLVFTLFFATIYPEFIAPLFDKYTPLKEGPLRSKIENLAASLQFPLKKLYVVEGSKRSSHSNAYLYGFWNNKRIVLYDTLIANYHSESEKVAETTAEVPTVRQSSETSTNPEESINGEWEKPDITELSSTSNADKTPILTDAVETAEKEEEKETAPKGKDLGMNDEEVVAVLGHELGHWKLNHTLFHIIIAELNMLLCLTLFSFLYKWPVLYEAFGFVDSQPTLIGLVIILQFVFAPYNELVSFLMTCQSRRCEFAADEFSAQLGMGEKLGSSLIKMSKDNLANPVHDKLFSQWHHSHPPVDERLEALRKYI